MPGQFSSFPFDGSFVDNFSHPLFITAERAPATSDVQPPGTSWLDGSVSPKIIYQTIGAGIWQEGGNPVATTTVCGIVTLDDDLTVAEADTVPTSVAAKAYTDSVVAAGAPVATTGTSGIGRLVSDANAVAEIPSTGAQAYFLQPSNLTAIFAEAPDIGGTTPGGAIFDDLTADGNGQVSLVSNAAGLFDVTGAGIDLTLSSDAGRVIVNGEEAATNAITLLSAAGGIDVNAALEINIDSSEAAVADAIRIVASAGDGGIDVDSGTGGMTIDSTGAISIDAAAASNFSVSGAGIDLSLVSAGGRAIINAEEAAANAITLLSAAGGIDVDAALQINIASSQNAASSIVIESSAGGIDILASGAGAGEDIDIIATGSSVNVSSTEDAALAIYLHADAGVSETVDIHSDQGTGVASVNVHSDVGGLTLTSGLASADAINFNASDAAGGIDVDCGSAGFIVDAAAGAISLDSALASNFTVTGAADLSLISTAGSLNLNAEEAVADAISVQSAAGGLDVDVALQMSLVSSQAAVANSIVIDASAADGGIDMDCGSGGFTLDATAGAISLDAGLASNITVTGAVDLSLISTAGSIILNAEEAAADAFQIQSAAGGLDLDVALGLDMVCSENAPDAIILNASAGGIDITAAGAAGEDIDIVCTSGSTNISAGEAIANAIVLSAGAGGIDIVAPGAGAGLDIDIVNTGGSINITATESIATAIVIDASGAASALQLDAGTGGVRFGTGLVVNVTSVNNAATPYTVLGTDYFLDCDTSAGVLTVTLPAATALSGRAFLIRDMGGSAGANNITINGGGTNLVGGAAAAATKVIAANYAGARVTSNGTIWAYEYVA